MGAGDIVYQGGAGVNQTGSIVNAVVIAGNTSGTSVSVSSGTLVLNGGTNITLSQNGNTIQINGPAIATLSQWFTPAMGTTYRVVGQSSIHVEPMPMPCYLSISRADMALSCLVTTNAGSSWSFAMTFNVGIYTNNASTLSLASQGGTTYNLADLSGGSSQQITGVKNFSVPINANMTPGNYWVAVHSITASTNSLGLILSQMFAPSQQMSNGSLGVTSAASNASVFGMGHWTAQTAALPAAISFNAIVASAAPDAAHLHMQFHNWTA